MLSVSQTLQDIIDSKNKSIFWLFEVEDSSGK